MEVAERAFAAGLRHDPDSSPCRLGLRRVRLQLAKKEAGNVAFR